MLLITVALVWWLGIVLLASLSSPGWRGWVVGGTTAGSMSAIAVGGLVVYVAPVTGWMLGWLWYAQCMAMGAVGGAVGAGAFRVWQHRRVEDAAWVRRTRRWLGLWVVLTTVAGSVCIATGAIGFEFYRYRWPSVRANIKDAAGIRAASIAMTSDGTEIAVATENGFIHVAEAKGVFREKYSRRVSRVALTAVAYDAKDELLACGDSAGTITVFRRADLHQVCALQSEDKPITAVVFIPGSMRLVSCSGDSIVMVWDLDQCDVKHAVEVAWRGCEACAVAGNGKTIAIADGATVTILSTAHLEEIEEHVVFSADSKLLAIGVSRGDRRVEIHVWDLDQRMRVAVLEHGAVVRHVGFMQSGAWVVSAGWLEPELRVWSIADRKVIHILRGSRYPIVDVAIAGGGRGHCAAVFADGTVALWDF